MKNFTLLIILFSLMLLACTKKKAEDYSTILGLDYYPLTTGKYIVYQVDSTVYTDLPKDTLYYKYLIKEKIADSYTDNTGQNAIRIERYIKMFNPKKAYDSIPWSMKEVYLLNANNKSIQMVENNVRFTKLIFPVQAKAVWNGNASNTLGEENYKYEYIDKSEKINSMLFENVLLVVQKEFHPKVLDYYYAEKYAKGFGLVYKEITDVVSNKNVDSTSVLQRIEYGLIYKQSFIGIGYE